MIKDIRQENLNKKNKEIYIPLFTPFEKSGEVNYQALAEYVARLTQEGVDGFYALGSSGECFLLTDEERKKSLEVICLNAGKKKIIAHVGSLSTKSAIELAKHAEQTGAHTVAMVPPFYFKYSFKELKAHYYAVAEATKLDLMVYHLASAVSGSALALDEFIEILSHPKIMGIKYTSSDFFGLQRIKELSNKKVFNGSDECLLSGLAAGADGGIGTTYNFMYDKILNITALFSQNKTDKALVHQNKVNSVIHEIFRAGAATVPACKYLTSLKLGIDLGGGRKPFLELTESEKKTMGDIYRKFVE